jgi:hypothetical protein
MADAQEIGQRVVDASNAHHETGIRELNGENTVCDRLITA